MGSSGTTHKVGLVLLRFLEVACGAIILGILGAFCQRVRSDGAQVDGRIIYAMCVGGISIAFALLSCALLRLRFMFFPFDFVLSIMWLVAFCLLITVFITPMVMN